MTQRCSPARPLRGRCWAVTTTFLQGRRSEKKLSRSGELSGRNLPLVDRYHHEHYNHARHLLPVHKREVRYLHEVARHQARPDHLHPVPAVLRDIPQRRSRPLRGELGRQPNSLGMLGGRVRRLQGVERFLTDAGPPDGHRPAGLRRLLHLPRHGHEEGVGSRRRGRLRYEYLIRLSRRKGKMKNPPHGCEPSAAG